MAVSLPQHQLSWSRHVSLWAPRSAPSSCIGGGPFLLRIEAGAGKKRVPRTDSNKVLNLRSIRKLSGTTQRPRLLVFCSEKHLYVQIMDDSRKETLVSVSTAKHNSTAEAGSMHPILDAAKKLGEEVAMECFNLGFSTVIFNKRGTLHGTRMRTFRLAAEEFGLNFEYPK